MHGRRPSPLKALDLAFTRLKAQTVTVGVFSFAMSVLLFASPLYMMQIYDRVLQSRSEGTLLFLTLIVVFLLGAYALLDFARARMLARIGTQIDCDIVRPLFEEMVRLSIAHPSANAHQFLQDTGKLRDFLSGAGVAALCDIPWTPLFLGVCFVFHPLLGWVATLGAVLIFALALLNERMTSKSLADVHGQAVLAQAHALAAFRNAETVAALGMEKSLTTQWFALYQRFLDSNVKVGDRGGALSSCSRFVRQLLQTAMLAAAAYLALRNAISPGAMMAISIISGRAFAPVDQMVGQWKQMVTARQAYVRLRRIFAAASAEAAKAPLPRPAGNLQMANVTLAVPATREVIVAGVDFKLAAGEMLAIVGPSGSGKSSLARAMVATLPPLSGAVRLDGSSVEQWDSEARGRNVGYVPQRVELFSGTIRDNIARFGNADMGEVIEAARLAGVDGLIRSKPQGYEMEIAPGAHQLSGRLHQGIGLARAFLGNPCLVVLDEPSVGLDFDGRATLISALRHLRAEGTTVVLISHDHGLQLLCDKALILADKRMKSFRPVSELMAKKPHGDATKPLPAAAIANFPSPPEARAIAGA